MHLKFKNKRISGILSVLPSNEIHFVDEISNYNFSEKQSIKLGKIMGYGSRRIVNSDTCVSDLCTHGLNYLFDNNLLEKDSFQALVLCTQSPDQFIPSTSSIIAGNLKLNENVICLDINQGCAGFEVGLMQAFMLLDTGSIDKVVLLNADVLSKKVSIKDRNSRPLVGDGASITIIENSINDEIIDVFIKMDGSGALSLQIPAGGFKLPSSEETSVLVEDSAGNSRSLNDLVMKGDEVFNFVQTKVPELLNEMFNKLNLDKDFFDYYFFHQPNKFMLEKLAEKLDIVYEKMPNNICEKYGNGSNNTVPLTICENLGSKSLNGSYDVCLGGFGVGLTWSLIKCKLENLQFCDIINY
ncbi:3-oxoacyl-ACP synthase III family protein [Flavobacterium sp.]|jgi:3-oxoacyl-[acyl-carrier-protein] synthase-3|uniref:3-oxoacyl-ACP synthase III family protein n=1 Tax=Flavobacterium sp. TaxID=239 RepID=UPI0037C0066D